MLVPSRIDSRVRALLLKLPTAESPIYVEVQPWNDALPNECMPAVQKAVRQDGGEIVLGWQIWQTVNLTEAKFHAVWRKPGGEMLNAGKRASMSKVAFEGEEAALFKYLEVSRINLEQYIAAGANSGSPCYCGGSLKYYECHGNDIGRALRRIGEVIEKLR